MNSEFQSPKSFQEFRDSLVQAVYYKNGRQLASLLTVTGAHSKALLKEFKNPTERSLKFYEGSLVEPWDKISIYFILVANQIAKKRYEDAFKEQTSLFQYFSKYFVQNDGWTLVALFTILRGLRDLAHDADLQAKYNNRQSEYREEAARHISKAFSSCMVDRTSPPDESRKWGIYYVAGLILQCYFRLNKLNLAKPIMRALDNNNDIPALSQYPRPHQVTFRYYVGMLAFLNEDYTKAEDELTLAFYNCYLSAHNNQQRIATYLIPLRILKGHLPSDKLLARFPLLAQLYRPFIDAIRKGDVIAYDKALETSSPQLLRLNIYLILERARELCIRGLFRRVWISMGRATRIPVPLFTAALHLSGLQDVSETEAECYIANMMRSPPWPIDQNLTSSSCLMDRVRKRSRGSISISTDNLLCNTTSLACVDCCVMCEESLVMRADPLLTINDVMRSTSGVHVLITLSIAATAHVGRVRHRYCHLM